MEKDLVQEPRVVLLDTTDKTPTNLQSSSLFDFWGDGDGEVGGGQDIGEEVEWEIDLINMVG